MWLLVLPALVLVIGLVLANTSLERRVDHPHADHYLVDFRELERNETGPYRWSQRRGALALDGLAHVPLLLEVHMTSPRAPGDTPATLQIERGDRVMGRFDLNGEWRRYRVMLPASPNADADIRLRIPTFNPEGGRRGLGLALQNWQVWPIEPQPGSVGQLVVASTMLGPGRLLILLLLPTLAAALAMALAYRLRLAVRSTRMATGAAALLATIGIAAAAALPHETLYWIPRERLLVTMLAVAITTRLLLPHWFVPCERWLLHQLRNDQRCMQCVVGTALLVGGVYVVLLPPWQHYDEPAHFEYAWMLANHSLRPTPHDIPAELAAIGGEARALGHLPGYHLIVSLPLRLVSGLDFISQLYVGRMVSLVLFALTAAIAVAIMRELTRPGAALRWSVPLALVLLPPFADLMTGVNNDVGAVAAFTLFLWGAVRTIIRGVTWWRFGWVAATAVICVLMKNTAAPALLFGPLALLLAIWQQRGWRWRWLVAAAATPLLIVIPLTVQWDDPAYWYRWGSARDTARIEQTDAPFGRHVLQVEGRPDWGPQGLSSPLFSTDARRLGGGTVTVGAWVWASRPAVIPAPGIMYDRGDFVVVVETPPMSVTTTPTFTAWNVAVPPSTGSLHFMLSAAMPADAEPITIYADGMILAAGRYPPDVVPQFADPAGQHGVWGNQPFTNLIRNSWAEDPGPRLRDEIEQASYYYLRRSPSQFLMALFDIERTAPVIVLEVIPWMIFALFGAYAWSQIRLEGAWWPWLFGIFVSGALVGSVRWWIGAAVRQAGAQRVALGFLALVGAAIWANAVLRLLPLLRTEPLPFPRYAFPVILVTLVALVGGWAMLFLPRLHDRINGLILIGFVILNCFAIAAIRGFFQIQQ